MSMRSSQAPPLIVLLLSACFALACRDELTGLQAVQLIDKMEASFSISGTLRFDWLLHRMGWAPGGMQLEDFSSEEVVLRGAGRSRYRAYVVERVLSPNIVLGPHDACVRSGLVRRGVIFFRDGGPGADAIELYGSDFHRPLAPHLAWCPNDTLRVLDPRPVLWYVPNPDDPRPAWWWGTGQASISPGVVVGPCPFLRAAHARFLREQRGVSCEVTRHEVWFEASIRRPDGSTFPLRLVPTGILGIRYTVHCDGDLDRNGKLCPGLDNHVQ
jgi:hypothetical protein